VSAPLRVRLLRRARLALLWGRRVHCPCCDGRFRRFMVDPRRGYRVCPRCGSQERHRLLALYLPARTPLGREPLRLLHWAPERALGRMLAGAPGVRYTSADLEPGIAMERWDITSVPVPDASFDAVICSHVLEHVADDRAALAEMWRILRPGGWAVVLVPVDLERERTLEDTAVVDPAERERLYWQRDHVRLYGADLPARLGAAGFEVTVDGWARGLDEAAAERHGIWRGDDVYVCARPAAQWEGPGSPSGTRPSRPT
jgi:SAM-dependent methyltransferase